MHGATAGILTAVLLGRSLAAQNADRVHFLPAGTSVNALVSDSAGNLYVGGSVNNHGVVMKLSPDGASTLFRFTIDGGGSDSIRSIVLGPEGSIFAAGTTSSREFPATDGSVSEVSANQPRAFVLKLDSNGNLQYATLIPGGSSTFGNGIAVNAKGEALLSGQLIEMPSPTFATTPNAVTGNSDVNTGFIVKLDSSGAKVLVAIRGFGLGPVAYDANDNIYFTGAVYGTASVSPTPGAFQSTHGLRGCGGTVWVGFACSYQFVAKISPDGTKLLYSTFVTGTYGANPSALIIDRAGNALIAGATNSRDYPVTPDAYQADYRVTSVPPSLAFSIPHPPVYPPPSTGYITKLNADGRALVWSTFFSGTGSESITGLALDSQDRLIIAGLSGSRDLPEAQTVPDGCRPGLSYELPFIAQLSAEGTSLVATRYVYGLNPGSAVRVALLPDGKPVLSAGDALKLVDLAAPTPLACTTDPADNARIIRVAPGQLITLFGDDFGSEGIAVSMNGIPAPVLYASAHQINVQVPVELAGEDVIEVSVQNADGLLLSRSLRVVARAPSAFLVVQDMNPAVYPAVICGVTFWPAYLPVARNEDGSFNACDNPAASGSTITLYLNALGATTPTVSLRYPRSGAVLGVEQDSSGVWRVQVQLPRNAASGSLEPLVEGVPVRPAFLAIWVKQ